MLPPPAHSQALADALPAAEHVVVPGVGHLLQLERPGPVTDGILGLLERSRGEDAERDAERAKAAGVEAVVFDRGGNKYHGRVAAIADGAREGGLSL